MLTRMTRTSSEVAGERAEAECKIERFGCGDPYLLARCRAVLDTFDWLEGARDAAPATGVARLADDAGIGAELSAARGLDERAWLTGRGADATRPQAVAETLAWFLRDPLADSPV